MNHPDGEVVVIAVGKEPFNALVALLEEVSKKKAVSEIIQPVIAILT